MFSHLNSEMQKADEVVPASATNQKPKASCDESGMAGRRDRQRRRGERLRAQISGADGQNVSQPVAASEGKKSDKTLVNGGVCLALAPLVAEMKLERAKGFEPSTFTLAT